MSKTFYEATARREVGEEFVPGTVLDCTHLLRPVLVWVELMLRRSVLGAEHGVKSGHLLETLFERVDGWQLRQIAC